MLQFIVPENANPQPVKDFLRRQAGISLTVWRKIKHNGTLLINGQPSAFHSIIKPNDIIKISWIEECHIVPEEMPIDIRYEDNYLMVVNKPAGLLVHPVGQERTSTLANAIMFYFRHHGLPYSFHPVHRLDRNTSGLLLIAKLSYIQHLLSVHPGKTFKRIYQAVVTGILAQETGIINAPIGRKPDSIIERIVRPDGQLAITHYRRLKTFKNASFVELELLTGRTHQIRVHLAHIGHALLGDDLYGGSTELIKRQALHASRLLFTHPVSGETIDITSPLPADFNLLLDRLKNK